MFKARAGQTPVLAASTTHTVAAGHPEPLIGFVQLGMNFNQSRAQSQSLWYGMWEVVDGATFANPFGIPGA